MRLFPNRKEDKNKLDRSRWMLWRWFDIVIEKELYLSRLTLFNTPWFGLRLHWIHKPDPDRDLHDHPWWFASFILRGWYREVYWEKPGEGRPRARIVNWFNAKNTVTAHRITYVAPKTLTLVLTGRRSKSWGFYNTDSSQFIPWENYVERQKATKM